MPLDQKMENNQGRWKSPWLGPCMKPWYLKSNETILQPVPAKDRQFQEKFLPVQFLPSPSKPLMQRQT